jgi:hypothetical protein
MRRFAMLALTACGAPAAPPVVSATAPAGSAASCALSAPRRTRVHLAFQQWLGRIGDRSWLIAERDNQHVLVALGDDGALAITPLPGTVEDKLAIAIDGTHLWFDRDAPGIGHNEVLFDIDLATSHPVIGPGEPLATKTLDGTSSFGISAQRMAAYSFAGSPPGPGFQMFDREHHVPLGTTAYTIYGLDEPPIRCVRDHCVAVTRPDSQGRSFSAQALAPDGTITIAPISSEHIESYVLVPDGDRTRVVWDGFDRVGLFARTLDASGQPTGSEVALLGSRARDVQLVPGPRPALAFRDDAGWVIATLAPHATSLAPAQRIGMPKATFLTIAQTTDGALAMAFTTDVSIDTVVPASKASAVFVPIGGGATAPIDVLFGEHRIGWAPFPLVAPGYAAALVLAQGDGEPDGELVILRAPCVTP